MHAREDGPRPGNSASASASSPIMPDAEPDHHVPDEERGLNPVPSAIIQSLSENRAPAPPPEPETEPQTRPNSLSEASVGAGESSRNYIRRKTSNLFSAITSASSTKADTTPVPPRLAALVQSYASSEIASEIQGEIDGFNESEASNLPDVADRATSLRSRRRASWPTQFRILSGRAFKNLYRDPALLAAHYVSSVAIACE